jgi:hypothetical protein
MPTECTRESEPLFLPPLIDKCAVLVAVSEVIHAASERRIKCSEARTLLIALKFVSRLMTEIDETGLSSSSELESQPCAEPNQREPSPQPAAGENRTKLTPAELDEFTRRLQNSAVQHLRHQPEGLPRKRVAGITDNARAVPTLAACSDRSA